ncbi:hypothetical protein [Amycolatopsis sp. WQ 127309]|uniref:hypothetical protein n=1 Tax=Amycolatopsis sp. WQ 127309 TaxID=2932773 RepID=UPI001FF25BD9|nr:hypothetical protein [Amycolatopsis sp. WQ 127309]UOZ08741.1 hypothetical protein MUY22_10900 [Amycolatopsis sp. WQ 127309]
MSEPKDPEQLLADALRAQAVFAPQVSPAPARDSEPGTDAVPTDALATPAELPSAYGLLSGASADSLERERAALDDVDAPTTFTPRPEPETVRQPASSGAQLPAYWILMLAVLLGLAAGSVVGLLTLV